MVTSIMAQEKKFFTLDDLLPGGRTYFQHSVPEQAYYEWWGDELVKLNVQSVSLQNGETLFTLDDINSILKAQGSRAANYLLTATFPYADRSIVNVVTGRGHALVDWVTKSVVQSWELPVDAENESFDESSQCVAYTVGHNLKVMKPDGKTVDVSKDGCLDIVYGESVHRNEFGISHGIFWSPSGKLLAFYKMDQSMVATYPQVDISARCAELVPDKYPMAGETSHKVYVGIFNLTTEKTVYLNTGEDDEAAEAAVAKLMHYCGQAVQMSYGEEAGNDRPSGQDECTY